jgi:hypothetical protein
MWSEEKSHGKKENPKFTRCCSNGKIILPPLAPLHPLMVELIVDKGFMDNIRMYNASFSFVSFNCQEDQSLKKGIYSMRILGKHIK